MEKLWGRYYIKATVKTACDTWSNKVIRRRVAWAVYRLLNRCNRKIEDFRELDKAFTADWWIPTTVCLHHSKKIYTQVCILLKNSCEGILMSFSHSVYFGLRDDSPSTVCEFFFISQMKVKLSSFLYYILRAQFHCRSWPFHFVSQRIRYQYLLINHLQWIRMGQELFLSPMLSSPWLLTVYWGRIRNEWMKK